MDNDKDNVSTILDRVVNQAYERGVKDGRNAIVLKLAKAMNNEGSDKPCLLYLLGLPDLGCPLDCVECMENHIKEGNL